MRLTKRAIEATAHHGKLGTAHYLWDDEVAGLGHLPRLARVVLPGLPYHVTHRAEIGACPLFPGKVENWSDWLAAVQVMLASTRGLFALA